MAKPLPPARPVKRPTSTRRVRALAELPTHRDRPDPVPLPDAPASARLSDPPNNPDYPELRLRGLPEIPNLSWDAVDYFEHLPRIVAPGQLCYLYDSHELYVYHRPSRGWQPATVFYRVTRQEYYVAEIGAMYTFEFVEDVTGRDDRLEGSMLDSEYNPDLPLAYGRITAAQLATDAITSSSLSVERVRDAFGLRQDTRTLADAVAELERAKASFYDALAAAWPYKALCWVLDTTASVLKTIREWANKWLL